MEAENDMALFAAINTGGVIRVRIGPAGETGLFLVHSKNERNGTIIVFRGLTLEYIAGPKAVWPISKVVCVYKNYLWRDIV